MKPTKYSQIYEVFSRITAELDHSAAAERREENLSDAERSGDFQREEYIRTTMRRSRWTGWRSTSSLNPYYLSTFFKQQTGEKFSDYVQRVKWKSPPTCWSAVART